MFHFGRWFLYSTPEEKKEQEQAYFQSVFPFGEQQKQLEQALLETCVQAPVRENEKLYQLLLVKNLYSQTKPTALEDSLARWYRGALLKRWPDPARAALLSLAQLSLQAQTPEALPDAEAILSNAVEIERELLPRLRNRVKRLWNR